MSRLRDVDQFLRGKVKLTRSPAANHDHYTFDRSLNIGLPTILALSRGTGQIDARNLKGLSVALGMKLDEFRASINCHVCGPMVHLCLAVYLMKFVKERLAYDPIVHGAGCRAMAKSISQLLSILDLHFTPNQVETRILVRLRADIEGTSISEFAQIRRDLESVVVGLLSKA